MIFLSLKRKVRKITPSVVAIGFRPNPDRPNEISIIGSGFAISNDGKILSVAHVYNQTPQVHRANLIAMVLVEQNVGSLGRFEWKALSLVGKNDQNDIALFQIDDYQNSLLQKLSLGNSEKIEVGEDVYFIGFPYAAVLINDGFGVTLIVNRGIVSNIKRDGADPSHRRNFIFVDAISNPGNSGCPLINSRTNKVVGVMSISFRIQSQNQPNLDIREPMHVCAARPINLAKDLLG